MSDLVIVFDSSELNREMFSTSFLLDQATVWEQEGENIAAETQVLNRENDSTQSRIVIRPVLPPTTTSAVIVVRPKIRLTAKPRVVVKPRLTETQKDVAYGAAVGALVGSASVLLFALLLLLSN